MHLYCPCLQVEYDMLDIDEPRFADDFSQFRRVVSDLERRLASVIIQVGGSAGMCVVRHLSRQPAVLLMLSRHSVLHRWQHAPRLHLPLAPSPPTPLCCEQGFDECTSVGASFKLFESFEGLVERDAISSDLERKHAELVRSFVFELQEASAGAGAGVATQRGVERAGRRGELLLLVVAAPCLPADCNFPAWPSRLVPLPLLQVADTFSAQRHDPVVPKNAAPHSGALAWVRGLRERITGKTDHPQGVPALAPARALSSAALLPAVLHCAVQPSQLPAPSCDPQQCY